MAKIQLSVEELLELARGDMPIGEIKAGLAKGMLEVWNSPQTQILIEKEAERLAQVKLERIIRDAYAVEKGRWGKPDTHSGWAIPVLREVLKNEFSIPHLLEALKPEIESLVQDSMGRVLVAFFNNQAREGK